MKIYPRRVIILPDISTYELNIKNSSTHELILLFRIKRAEQKVVTFGPKKGFVLPGETRVIPISLLSRDFVRTKLLVKLVAVPRSQVNSLDFEKSWQNGIQFKGEIKKIIDIIDSSANLEDIIESNKIISGNGHKNNKGRGEEEDQFSDMISEMSSFSYTQNNNTININNNGNNNNHHHGNNKLTVSNKVKSQDRSDSAVSAYELSSEFQSFGYESPSVLSPHLERQQNQPSDDSLQQVDILPETAIQVVKLMSQQLSVSPKKLKEMISQELQPEDLEKLATFFTTLMKTSKKNDENHREQNLHQRILSQSQSQRWASRDTETIDSRYSETILSDIKPSDGDEKVSVLSNESGHLSDQPKVNTTIQSIYSIQHQSQSNLLPPLQSHSVDVSRHSLQSQHTQHTHHTQQSQRSHHSLSKNITASVLSSIDHVSSESVPFNNNSTSNRKEPSQPQQTTSNSEVKHISQQVLDEKTLEVFSTLIPKEMTDNTTIHPKSIRMSTTSTQHSLNVSQSSLNTVYQQYTLEIFNNHVHPSLLKEIIEARILHAIESRQKISAINIQHTKEIFTCKDSLSLAFQSSEGLEEENTTEAERGRDPTRRREQNDKEKQLLLLRNAYLEDYFFELQMEHTSLLCLDASINRFHMLTSINLSNNQIKYIDGMIVLPNLLYLNLSYNLLKSLDYLQCLTNLKTLIVNHNRIESFKQSISLIIPLSNSLQTIDMSENPVCNDLRYAEEMILAFPKLITFDQIVLEKLYKSYTTNDAINKYKLLQQQIQQYPNKFRQSSGGGGRVPVIQTKLPEFPCVLFDEERKLLSTASLSKENHHQNQTQWIITNEKRFEFIQKVKRALGLKAFNVRKERVSKLNNNDGQPSSFSASKIVSQRDSLGGHSPPSSFLQGHSSYSTIHRNSRGSGGGGESGKFSPHQNHSSNPNHVYYVEPFVQSADSRLQYEIFQESGYEGGHEEEQHNRQQHRKHARKEEPEDQLPTRQDSFTYSRSKSADEPSPIEPTQQPAEQYYDQERYSQQQRPYYEQQVDRHSASNEEKYPDQHQQQLPPPPPPPPSSSSSPNRLRTQPTSFSPRHAMRSAAQQSPSRGSPQQQNLSTSRRSKDHYHDSQIGVTHFDSIFQGNSSPPHFITHTTSSKKVGRTNEDILIPHWGKRSNSFDDQKGDLRRTIWTPTTSKRRTRSKSPTKRDQRDEVSVSPSLLHETESVRKRRKAFGILDKGNNYQDDQNMTYYSDTDLSTRGRVALNLSRSNFDAMQENERYSIWHPRYRVPKPIFGFSKPFCLRPAPEQKDYAPLFDKTVQRIREGFEKLPTRGTFPRAPKGLTAEWYPMDYNDLEAIRRQGYFHETIGQITKFSYQDFRTEPWEKESVKNNNPNQSIVSSVGEAKISNSGSTLISPQKEGRRGIKGAHISRMYKSSEGRVENTAEDNFSGYRKWHPDLLPTNNTNPLNNSILASGSYIPDQYTLNNSTIETSPTYRPSPQSAAESAKAFFSNSSNRAPSPLTAFLNGEFQQGGGGGGVAGGGGGSAPSSRRPSITSAITLDTGIDSQYRGSSNEGAPPLPSPNSKTSGKKVRTSVLGEIFGTTTGTDAPPVQVSPGPSASIKKILKTPTTTPTNANQHDYSTFFADDSDLIHQSYKIIKEASSIDIRDSISYISSNVSFGSNSPKNKSHTPAAAAPAGPALPPAVATAPQSILKVPRSNHSSNHDAPNKTSPTSASATQHYFIDNYSGDYISSETMLRSLKVEKTRDQQQYQQMQATSIDEISNASKIKPGIAEAASVVENSTREREQTIKMNSMIEGAALINPAVAGNDGMSSYLTWLKEQHLSQDTQEKEERERPPVASIAVEYDHESKVYSI